MDLDAVLIMSRAFILFMPYCMWRTEIYGIQSLGNDIKHKIYSHTHLRVSLKSRIDPPGFVKNVSPKNLTPWNFTLQGSQEWN